MSTLAHFSAKQIRISLAQTPCALKIQKCEFESLWYWSQKIYKKHVKNEKECFAPFVPTEDVPLICMSSRPLSSHYSVKKVGSTGSLECWNFASSHWLEFLLFPWNTYPVHMYIVQISPARRRCITRTIYLCSHFHTIPLILSEFFKGPSHLIRFA